MIATGGLAPLVVDECAVFTEHQPWLTLLGLEIVFDRNSPDRYRPQAPYTRRRDSERR